MTILDYFVLLIVVASVASGAVKGIIRVIVSVAFTVGGLFLAAHSYAYAAAVLRFVAAGWLANLLGFLAVFLSAVVAGFLLSRWLREGLRRAHLGWIDHAVGAAFGFVRGVLVCMVLCLALVAFAVSPETVQRAALGPALLEGTELLADYLTSRDVRERFFEGYEKVKQLSQQEH